MENKDYFEFYNPVKVLAGKGALENLPNELERQGSRRPMLVADRGVEKAGLLDIVGKAFAGSPVAFGAAFLDVPPDSGTAVVATAARAYREAGCDGLVALGGGSVIDTAKAVNILVTLGGERLTDYSGAGAIDRPLRPLIVIPTTAGTGSECTSVAVVRDDERKIKLAFSSPRLLPVAAIVDARMTLTLPPSVTAATGMDALTHAIEASYGLARNPLSDAFAHTAIELIAKNLTRVVDRPGDAEGRFELALASTMAGAAFSNSMVGLVHSLGHATGGVCHVPHGVAMSVFLPYVLEYNLRDRAMRIGELLLPLVGPDRYFATASERRPAETIAAIRALRDGLWKAAKLPRTLSETGKVRREDFGAIAKAAIDDASITFNSAEAGYEDCMGLLERAWE